jgi:acetylglutamate kinase
MHVHERLQTLRTAIPYIRAYKSRVFVIKFGGRLCEPGKVLDHLADQIALLYQVGIRVVIVHGGGEQATALSKRLGQTPNIVAGRRVTDDQALEIVKMAFAGTVNTDVVAALRRAHVPAVGLTGIDGGMLIARRRPLQRITDPSRGETTDVDFGHVNVLTQALDGGFVPVVCALAADAAGNVLNVNADTIASRIAVEIDAAKYFLVTTVDGVLHDRNDAGSLQTYIDLDGLTELIESGAIAGGMLPKLAACSDALRGGVSRVHIINGLTPDTLLGEVFTNEGCGTLIVEKRKAASEDGAAPYEAPAGEAGAATP